MAVSTESLNSTLIVKYQTGTTPAGGKTFSISIPDPREDLDKTEAEAVMDTIIQKNIFLMYTLI